jgi:hypothetical protein
MGMFFYVKPDNDDKCPYCGTEIKDWQSKSSDKHDEWGGCCERHPDPLPTLEKDEVENFYTSCPKCEKWIEYEVVKEKFKLKPEEDITH